MRFTVDGAALEYFFGVSLIIVILSLFCIHLSLHAEMYITSLVFSLGAWLFAGKEEVLLQLNCIKRGEILGCAKEAIQGRIR
jgi:hypothetical protein